MGRPKSTEIIGKTYSFVKVIGRSDVESRKYKCLCTCGKEFDTTRQRLEKGSTKSCGCKRVDLFSKSVTKHGAASKNKNTPEYQSYIAMLQRCYNPCRDSYQRYGGRGIFVEEDAWLEESPVGFLNFLRDIGKRPDGTSLDRIDNDSGYSKQNCRWASRSTQSANTDREKTDRNTSKYRGVSLRKGNGKYVARIGDGSGGYIWLGEFNTEDSAAIAYNNAAIKIHGENAKLNDVG